MENLEVGILSLGIYMPNHSHDSQKIANETGLSKKVIEEEFGILKKPVPGPRDHVSYMAARAAERAILRAGISPQDIDLIIWTGGEYKDYPNWTAGIKLQYDIGAVKAWSFDLGLGSGTTILAMKLAQDMMRANDNINMVLLAGGYRNGDLVDYQNPQLSFMYSLGASGTAMLIKKAYKKNRLLSSSFINDGSLAETVIVPAGGTKKPLTAESIKNKEHYYNVVDKDFMFEKLAEISFRNLRSVIIDSLQKSGYTLQDLDYLAVPHMKRASHNFIVKELNLTEDKTIYLEDYGHMGQNDQIVSLDLARIEGKVKSGDLVTFVSEGIGYAWSAITIKWG